MMALDSVPAGVRAGLIERATCAVLGTRSIADGVLRLPGGHGVMVSADDVSAYDVAIRSVAEAAAAGWLAGLAGMALEPLR